MTLAASIAALSLPGEIPALPLHTAGKYVAAAYVVLFAIVLVYVAIMAIRLSHIQDELGELTQLLASSPEGEQREAEPSQALDARAWADDRELAGAAEARGRTQP